MNAANRIYERRFLRNMVARFKKKAGIFPEIYSSSAAEAVRAIRSANSMRAFDQEVVARYAPFADADDYYRQVASSRWASEFAVPTLIIHALDDPFIRMLPSTREALLENEHVTFVETRHGGHCAFLAPGKGSERHWAEKSLVEWLSGVVAEYDSGRCLNGIPEDGPPHPSHDAPREDGSTLLSNA